jgi:hypothetical protein
LRRALIDPAIAARRGRVIETTGEGLLVEFQSVLDVLRRRASYPTPIADLRVISVFRRRFICSETRIETGNLFFRRSLGLSGRYILLNNGRLGGGIFGVRVYIDAKE